MTTALNQSKVKMWRRCQKQFAFRYDYVTDGRELVPSRKKLPLYRGSWMHALQEALHHQWAGFDDFTITFGEGKNKIEIEAQTWEDVHDELCDQFDQLFDEEKEELEDLPDTCERLFRSYLRFWKEDQDRYTVAEYRGKPMIEYLVQGKLPGLSSPFKGRIDLVVEDEEYGGFWIWDAKWVSKIPPPEERIMSPQSLMYVWALRELRNLDIRGFVYNYGRTKPPAIPRTLKTGTLSLRKRMDTDLYTYVHAMKELHGDRWKMWVPHYSEKLRELKGREALWFRRERIPIEEEAMNQALGEFIASGNQIANRQPPLEAPRSYFYSCKFGCDYHELCVAEFTGLNIEPLIKQHYEEVSERYAPDETNLLSA